MSASNTVLNELFAAKLSTQEGREKIAALGSDWIRDRLREESFARKVLPPKTVTRADLQVSVNHDTLVKIVESEPESRAMTMSFRGQPTTRYIRSARFEVPFHTVASERYEKTEQELMAYTMPITQVIKQNVVKDIQEVEDYVFLTHVENACQTLQKDAQGIDLATAFTNATAFTARNVSVNGIPETGKVKSNDTLFNTAAASDALGVVETLVSPVQKDDLTKLFQKFPGDGGRGSRLRGDVFLITDTDWEDINTWTITDVGERAAETTVDGYKHKTVVGRRYIRTLKTDILRPGNIYAFTAPEYLGGFLVLNKTKFYADKERNRVSFEAWEDVGLYVGNIAGCRKLELYAGSVDAGIVGLQTARAPVNQTALGTLNNLIDEGGVHPSVSGF